MLTFLKRRAYRSDIRANMSYLLGFGTNDVVLAAIFKLYPNIWQAIDNDFVEGKSSMDSAVGVLTIALTHEIESRVPQSEYHRMEAYILENEGDAKFVLEKAIKVYFGQLLTQKDMNGITEFMYTFSITEIIGALKGMSRDERSRRRMTSSFMQAISPTEP